MVDFTLYFFPGSYYSLKALVALFEKDVKFKQHFVFIHSGEQLHPWYMRMNPAGVVPTLKDGDKLVTESEQIIDYIDSTVHTGSSLVPSKSTAIGQEVEKLRKRLDEVQIGSLTYGLLHNQDLSITGIKAPKKMLKTDRKKFLEDIDNRSRILAEKHPDLREAYLAKIPYHKQMIETMENRDLISKIMDNLDKLFDEIESILKRNKAEKGLSEFWLVGPHFTAADITFFVMLDRITLLGIEERYISQEKRPYVFDYYQRIGKRKSVIKVRDMMKSVPRVLFVKQLKQAIPYVASVATLAVAVGAAYMFMKRK